VLHCGVTVAAGLVGCAVSGCTGDGTDPAPVPEGGPSEPGVGTPQQPPDQDVNLVLSAVKAEEVLLALCGSVTTEHPSLRVFAVPLRSRQRRHVAGLRALVTDVDVPRSTAQQRSPSRPAHARARLMAALERARDRRLDDCLAATAGPLAQHFASLSASHAATVDQLRRADW